MVDLCRFGFKPCLACICSDGILRNCWKWMSRGRHYSKCQAPHRSNTCPQSNLNWVMVLHHVTVPRQLTGGPLLCVRGVTCHMIDDTTGVQGLRLIASLNHCVWRSADGLHLPHARPPACPRTQDTCIQTQAMLQRQTKHTRDDRENNSGSKLQFTFTCRKVQKFKSEKQEPQGGRCRIEIVPWLEVLQFIAFD